MYYKYVSPFNLTDDVNDFNDAFTYLIEDNMTQYLGSDITHGEIQGVSQREDIYHIQWKLLDTNHGVIELFTNVEMNDEALKSIGQWCDGQNSDGLGEGFEQQDFCSNEFCPVDGAIISCDECYDCDISDGCEGPEYGMTSFRWQDEKMEFSFVEMVNDIVE